MISSTVPWLVIMAIVGVGVFAFPVVGLVTIGLGLTMMGGRSRDRR